MNEDFAQRISQYLQSLEADGAPADRPWRPRSDRRPYTVAQWVAPRYGDDIPRPSQFREVRCQDLSTSGLAFYWPELPDFQDVLVRLGDAQTALCLTARVVRIEPRDGPNGRVHLVGCRFTGRIPSPDAPPS